MKILDSLVILAALLSYKVIGAAARLASRPSSVCARKNKKAVSCGEKKSKRSECCKGLVCSDKSTKCVKDKSNKCAKRGKSKECWNPKSKSPVPAYLPDKCCDGFVCNSKNKCTAGKFHTW